MLLIMTSTGDRLLRFVNIDKLVNDLEPPKTVFSEFFAIFGCSAHFNTAAQIAMQCLEIDQITYV